MVSLKTVQASNAGIRALPNITALFVGGTSGIGQSTLRQLARHADSPTAYIIGRNKARARPFLSELQQLSPRGRFHFIEADVSLVRNVDAACRQILQQEKQLNFLFMTPGGVSLGGRNGMILLQKIVSGCLPADKVPETAEGIDYLFALRYYSRMRFIQNLLPLLESSGPSRVISVYGGGFEYSINTSDLDLKHNFSLLNAYKHSITMTSLSMEHLANTHPSVSFIHVYPGLVGTNIYTNSFPAPISTFYNYVMWPFMWPFSVNLSESGERHLFHLSSARYPAKHAIASQGVPVETADVATGTNGEIGSGAYLLNWKGEVRPSTKVLAQYREQRIPGLVWDHTETLLDETARR
jgi:NAD(P)-dependent dehydrogenase (short-subunit alcohol dehydrogenase family)